MNPVMKQLGQKSVLSLFSSTASSSSSSYSSSASAASNNPRRRADLSLQDFLDKTTTTKEKEKEKEKEEKKKLPFDSVCRSVLMNEAQITQRSVTRPNPPDAPPCSSLASSCTAERVCDSLRVQRASTKKRLVDELNRKRRKRNHQNEYIDKPSRLLVLGDEPVSTNRPKLLRSESARPIFNHYSDGNGWWEQDMVGLEATACVEWEGIGSMSLGDPFMSPL